uniref:Uncharacterized protein n=1 Tax=Psilocybe cubensis TaxID=181762 RepID=A0A8H8CNP2_PSICU
MSMRITIHPFSDHLHMYGPSDPSSAYSLSGHISLSVTSPFSLFESRRTARLLLQSLTITFEGQSEIFTPNTGYSSLRVCSVTHELAPSVPIELSNEGCEDSSEPSVWNVIFNLPIPGWLPPTTTIGIEELGTRYALYATAKFANVDEEHNNSWGFSTLCAPFRSRVKCAEAKKPIVLHRFMAPPKVEITDLTTLNYLVNSTPSSKQQDAERGIPMEVLSKIQVLASVPEYVDISSDILPLTLRLRTKDLAEEHCKRIQLTEVHVDITQQEKCRYRPSSTYHARYPLPPQDLQPPNLPLRDPHPISSVYDVGLYVSSEFSESASRIFSLLPSEESGSYKLSTDNYVFANDALRDGPPTWYTMDTTVPFIHENTAFSHDDYDTFEWGGAKIIRPTLQGPLYTVQHEALVSLTYTYDLQDNRDRVATERLSFRIPVTFGNVPLKPSATGVQSLENADVSQLSSHPYQSTSIPLPAYFQLYDRNGDRKIDYSTPLPLYTPRSEAPLMEPSDSPAGSTDCTNICNLGAYQNGLNTNNEKAPTSLLMGDSGASQSI